jgi:adenylosuccinate synthase
VPKQIVLISGSVASGKTTLSDLLRSRFQKIEVLKTKEVIKELALKKLGNELPAERKAMQEFGDRLDRETNGQWVRDALQRLLIRLGPLEPDAIVIVDAVRIPAQIKAIRKAYGFSVLHFHLQTPSETLSERYRHRSSGLKELASFSEVKKNPTEARVQELETAADVVINTKLCRKEDVLAKAATYLGLYSNHHARLVDVLVGGQYGSEGKGHIASYLAPEYSLLVRVGGPNAGHKVFLADGPYTHHQLPSGTLRSEAKLLIGAGAVLNAEYLMREIAECNVNRDRLSIDPRAMVISRADIAREAGLKARIGSTGQGVGFATARRIVNRGKRISLAGDVPELAPFIHGETWEILEDAYARGHKVLVEGTQGIALSLYHGDYPHVTSRDTSVSGSLAEAGITPSRVRKVVMVCRTFPIRVESPAGGDSGPMGQEISWPKVAKRSGINLAQLRKTERTSTTDRSRRVGEFDWVLLRKAATLNGPTDIALTFADYLDKQNEKARRYEKLTPETIRFIEEVERVAAAPASLISTRFGFRSIIDRRTW